MSDIEIDFTDDQLRSYGKLFQLYYEETEAETEEIALGAACVAVVQDIIDQVISELVKTTEEKGDAE